ncbi:MAG: replicative DNA helicase [Bacilli bacterium]|nr:replicative DNA helicase [Bacilli bacterium]
MERREVPYSLEAEQSVLGSAFLSKDALTKICDDLNEDDFYLDSHKIIYNVLKDLHDEGIPVDITIVTDRLESAGELTKIGNIDYLVEIANFVPSAANLEYYINIVHDKSVLRKLIEVSNEISADSYTFDGPINNALDSAESKIFNIVNKRKTSEFRNIQDVVYKAQSDLEKLSENNNEITGVATGFYDLDKLTSGFHENELIIIAARPGMGKTAFALNIATNVARATNKNVAIFNFEMSAEQLVNRMLSSIGQINFSKFRNGNFDNDDWKKLGEGVSILADTNIKIDDTAGSTISDIRSKCRRLASSKEGLAMVVIDYLQLINGTNKSNQNNRQQEVSDISRGLKMMAMELHVPVIALAQLSRAVEGRPDKRPLMSDLRESGSIEQDADMVGFLYRDDYYNKEAMNKDVSVSEFIIGKNRNGPTKTIEFLFKGSTVTFANYQGESKKE